MKLKTIISIYVLTFVFGFASVAHAGFIEWLGGNDTTYNQLTVNSGLGIKQIYPGGCTQVTVLGDLARTLQTVATIPKPVTYTTPAVVVDGVSKLTPLSNVVLRTYWGRLRMQLSAAPGAGETITATMKGKCLAQTGPADVVTSVLTIGGSTKVHNENDDWVCQDQAYPSAVTLFISYTAGAGSIKKNATICYDTFKTIDPCPTGTATTETAALCTKD